MLSYLLRQLINSCGIFLRTIRAFFTRKAAGAVAGVRRAANFSRKATKVATASFQGAAAAVKKPTRREDYIETRRLLISKSFIILALVQLVLLGLLVYYIVWPFVLSRFLTARFYQEDSRLETWSGRVVVCYDETKKIPRLSGTLTDGLLQGRGKEYDEDGLLVYDGSYTDGQRSGSGRLYEAGSLVYEGSFANGLPDGNGTEYKSGHRRYTGQFSCGVYSGTGTAYADDGETVIYKGEFADGLYEGSGSCYLENGDVIKAEFVAGQTDGNIHWYVAGSLWYEGSADNLTPNGLGTLYSADGEVVYTGRFANGTLDGQWLLERTAEELREAFGAATMTERDDGQGFSITNSELGLTVLCSYRQGEQEAKAYSAVFEPEGEITRLLPTDANGQTPTQLVWGSDESLPAEQDTSDAEKNDEGDSSDVLSRVLGDLNTDDDGDAAALLNRVTDLQDVQSLTTAMAEWFVENEKAKLLEENRELLQMEQEKLQKQLSRDESSETEAAALEERLTQLERKILQCESLRESAALTVIELTETNPQGLNLAGALLLFDPSQTDEAAFYNAAASYEQETAATALQTQCKAAILDLKLLYAEAKSAAEDASKAVEQEKVASVSYSKGTATEKESTEAHLTQNEAYMTLLDALLNFTCRAAEANTLSGGWLAEEYAWMK